MAQTYIIKKEVRAGSVGEAIKNESKGTIVEVYTQSTPPDMGFKL